MVDLPIWQPATILKYVILYMFSLLLRLINSALLRLCFARLAGGRFHTRVGRREHPALEYGDECVLCDAAINQHCRIIRRQVVISAPSCSIMIISREPAATEYHSAAAAGGDRVPTWSPRVFCISSVALLVLSSTSVRHRPLGDCRHSGQFPRTMDAPSGLLQCCPLEPVNKRRG